MFPKASRGNPTTSGTPKTHSKAATIATAATAATTATTATAPWLNAILVLEIASESLTDPRSVRIRLKGGRVRGLAGARIDRALARRGLLPEVCR
jgi:hypothetical protein